MRWPWSRTPRPRATSNDKSEATEARLHAEDALQESRGRTHEIRQVAEEMREHRRVNHFAELIGKTFRGYQ